MHGLAPYLFHVRLSELDTSLGNAGVEHQASGDTGSGKLGAGEGICKAKQGGMGPIRRPTREGLQERCADTSGGRCDISSTNFPGRTNHARKGNRE